MKKILTLICILISSVNYGQLSKKDSIYQYKAAHHGNRNIDSLFYYAKLLQSSNNIIAKYDGVFREITAHYRKGNYKDSEILAYKLINLIDKNENPYLKRVKLECYNRLFWIYKNTNQLSKAFNITLKSKAIIDSIKVKNSYYSRFLLSTKSNLANIKLELGLFNEAKNIYEEINSEISQMIPQLKGFELYSSLILKSSILNLTGESFLHLSTDKDDPLLDSALVFYRKAFKVTELFNPRHKNSKPLYDLKCVKVLIKKEEYLKALKIIDDNSLFKDDIYITQTMNFLKSVIFHNLKEVDSSLYYSHKFLRFKKKTPSTEKNRVVVLNILADEYKNINRTDSALKYSHLALNHLNDLTEKKSEANNSHYLYDFNKVKNLNRVILDTEKRKYAKRYLILGVFVLIVCFIGFSYFKKNKKLKIQVEGISERNSNVAPSSKKEYSINYEIETKIMKGLKKIEISKEYLHPEFNINSLAKELKTNTSYLSSVVNQKKEKSFKNYIIELRIQYLINELTENNTYRNYTIKALGEEIGYTNASAFTRAFKKHTGKTPSAFIKNLEADS